MRKSALDFLVSATGSPIEAMLAREFSSLTDGYSSVRFVADWGARRQPDFVTIVGAQVPIGPYRADFLFKTRVGAAYRILVVECDGHDFHERTKHQAAHDRKRDRWMVAHGVTCLRFTGSEIFRRAPECAIEIELALCRGKEDLFVRAGHSRPCRQVVVA